MHWLRKKATAAGWRSSWPAIAYNSTLLCGSRADGADRQRQRRRRRRRRTAGTAPTPSAVLAGPTATAAVAAAVAAAAAAAAAAKCRLCRTRTRTDFIRTRRTYGLATATSELAKPSRSFVVPFQGEGSQTVSSISGKVHREGRKRLGGGIIKEAQKGVKEARRRGRTRSRKIGRRRRRRWSGRERRIHYVLYATRNEREGRTAQRVDHKKEL